MPEQIQDILSGGDGCGSYGVVVTGVTPDIVMYISNLSCLKYLINSQGYEAVFEVPRRTEER